MSSNMRIKKNCDFCGSQFVAKTRVTQFCGDPCAKKAYKKRMRLKAIYEAEFAEEIEKTERKKEFREAVSQREYLSINQTMDYLGVSRMTVHRKMKSGEIPFVRLGGRVLILKHELDKLLKL